MDAFYSRTSILCGHRLQRLFPICPERHQHSNSMRILYIRLKFDGKMYSTLNHAVPWIVLSSYPVVNIAVNKTVKYHFFTCSFWPCSADISIFYRTLNLACINQTPTVRYHALQISKVDAIYTAEWHKFSRLVQTSTELGILQMQTPTFPRLIWYCILHYCDVIMGVMTSLISSLMSVYSTAHSSAV